MMDGPLQACVGTGVCVAVSVQIKNLAPPRIPPKHLDWRGGHTPRTQRKPEFCFCNLWLLEPINNLPAAQKRGRVGCHPSSLEERRTCARCLSSLPLSLHLLPHSHFTFTHNLLSVSSPSLHSVCLLWISTSMYTGNQDLQIVPVDILTEAIEIVSI